jgi:hypothetical protein
VPGWLSLAAGLGRDLVWGRLEAAKKNAIAAVIAYLLIAIFAIAALCSLYGAIWRLIAHATDELAATWIMLGINLALALLVYVIYRIYHSSVTRAASGRVQAARHEVLAGGSTMKLAFEAGRAAEAGLRGHAKTLVVTAIVLGLAIGARPELLGVRRGRRSED